MKMIGHHYGCSQLPVSARFDGGYLTVKLRRSGWRVQTDETISGAERDEIRGIGHVCTVASKCFIAVLRAEHDREICVYRSASKLAAYE